MVRLHLEYGLKKDIVEPEKVQKRASNLIGGLGYNKEKLQCLGHYKEIALGTT